jgi:hypothetical protein
MALWSDLGRVRFGSLGEIAMRRYDVRFTPEAGIETAGIYEYTP